MNDQNLSQLEFLPNEILQDLFQYLDARSLFRAFNNLNSRFNALIRSLNNLCVYFKTSNPHEINDLHIYAPYVHIAILGREANININHFTNIRCLKFLKPTCEQIDMLDSLNLSYLEHLSLGFRVNCYHPLNAYHKHNRCDKVFSNDFPYLISAHLLHSWKLYITSNQTQLIYLKILIVGCISLISYQIILIACPNLYSFRFMLPAIDVKPQELKQHLNLKRMIIQYLDRVSPLNDYDIDIYLSCVPNLEQLCIHRRNENARITSYLKYNWLATSIDQHLLSLRRFIYHFNIYLAKELIRNDRVNILKHLEETFKYLHHDKYHSKLVFKLFSRSIDD